MDHKIKKLLFKQLLKVFLLLFTSTLYAQRYNFQHYDLTNGLSQSQVMAVCQDKEKQIWLSNFGGINCFDGKKFNSYSLEDGLPSNSNFAITRDNNGNIWLGGSKGLTAFTSKGIINYKFKDKVNTRSIMQVLCDKNGVIWALVLNSKLYKLVNNQLIAQQIVSKDDMITSIALDKNGDMHAAIYKSGIYGLDKTGWKLNVNIKQHYIKKFLFSDQSSGTINFISEQGLFQCNANYLKKITLPELYPEASELTGIVQDHHKNLWIGTNKGAFLINGQSIKYFNENNGFTNERVLDLYCDEDNRIWFGTDGSGLYSYDNDDFVIYDKSQGLNNEIVMSLAKDSKGQMYWGTNGGGLLSFANNKIKHEIIYSKESAKLRINSLLSDKNDNLWVGTDNLGLWVKMAGKSVYSPVSVNDHLVFFHLAEGYSNKIWAATNYGCFYLDRDSLVRISGINHFCSSVLVRGPDSVFVGSLNGIQLIKNKKLDSNFKLSNLEGKNVLSLHNYGPFILIGTNDHGLFIWNTKTNAVNNINAKNGLQSNTVYSIDIVNGSLWLGTGKGINKFRISDSRRMDLARESIFNPIVETNQNAILHTDTNIWLGTTHGLYVYKTNRDASTLPVPNTVIQSVWLSAKDKLNVNYTYQNGYRLPVSLSLPSDKSHISIEFQAVEYSDAANIQYQYQLEGMDKTYSKPVTGDYLDYPSLPPGQYTFKVRAINSAGQYNDPATFSFIVTPTFIQSVTFKILITLILLSAAYGIYRYKIYQNDRKARYIEALKLEEQASVRRQTAEDFHDDLGNKLTRINLLSELLDKRIEKNKPDEKLLIHQIRASVAELYSGTKNILWALNPDNDNLYDVYDLIINFGRELFSGSGILFRVSDNDPEFRKIRLPLGTGRNIILIGKELLHNILQHAEAKTVTLSIEITSYKYICITISDNGRGFESDQILAGNGLRNMQNRAKRLNGKLDIDSKINVGTISQVTFPIPK